MVLEKASYIRQMILERNIEYCKDITPEQMEIISLLAMEHDNFECIIKGNHCKYGPTTIASPLLSIELQDESSVPKVFYKGEEVKHKTNVQFDWDTDTEYMGGLTYAIEHYEHGKVPPVLNRVERRVKGHAVD